MIRGLNGLRAIAFLLVFFFHAHYFDSGWMGVQLFFVLSGFLITGILLDMKASLPKSQYFKKFYGRRLLRIFPLYYFYLIVMGIVATWLISIDYRPTWMELFTTQVKFAALYIYNFHAATIFNTSNHFLAHLWSLCVEEQFYLLWPIMILLAPEKWHKKLFIALFLMGPLMRLGVLFVQNTGEIRMLVSSTGEAVYALPSSHVDAFAIGAYISRYSIPKAKEQFFLLLGLVPAIGFITQYLATGELGSITSFGYPLHMSNGYQFIWGYSILNYFFAIAIYVVVKHKLFVQFLESKPLQYLGKISYGLYVYHLPILWFALSLEDIGIILSPNLLQPTATIITFLGTLLVASLSYRFIEKPILNLKDHLFPLQPDEELIFASQNAVTRPAKLKTAHI